MRFGTPSPSVILAFSLLLGSCSSCERPAEPVLPADVSGAWIGAYTVADGRGHQLIDSLFVDLVSDRGEVTGGGTRVRTVEGRPPIHARVTASGNVAVSSFRLELEDVETGHSAVFAGKVFEDTLSGRVSVDGLDIGRMAMVRHRPAQ